MPGSNTCATTIVHISNSYNSDDIDGNDCNSTRVAPGNNKKFKLSTNNVITRSTHPLGLSSVVTRDTTNKTKIASSSSSITPPPPPPPPPPAAGRQTKPSIVGTKSPYVSSNNHESQPLICTLCSSYNVTEINIKIKSCQNCNHVIVDEIGCTNQPSSDDQSKSVAGENSNSSQSYYQHLALIAKKLKNIYKSKIPQNSNDFQNDEQQQNHHQQQERRRGLLQRAQPSSSSISKDNSTMATMQISEKDKLTSHTGNNHCNHHHCYHDHQYPDSLRSKNKLPLSFSSDKNPKNKDVLILRICDLDLKNKPDAEFELKSASPRIDCNGEATRPTNTSNNKHTSKLSQDKKTLKSRGTQSESTTKIKFSNFKQPVHKIVVISDEYKKNSEKNDFRIENRKDIMKKFRQNNAISKSLDVILPQSDWDLQNSFEKASYVFASKSVTNLNDMNIEDDDEGPFESINSVELIFISDEFLNKAIKHDLKILKNKKTDTFNIDSNSLATKKKSTKNQNKSPSPRNDTKESVSPTITITTTTAGTVLPITSEKSTQSQTIFKSASSSSSSNSKKLIVISEDFKRKSLENNVVIVDGGGGGGGSNETAAKRKNLKLLKLTRQQSSIDDVGNQMTSHAFCSFEEPDEQCLESKEIKTPD